MKKWGDPGQGFTSSAGGDESRRPDYFVGLSFVLPGGALFAGPGTGPGSRPGDPHPDRVIMFICPDHGNPECLFSLLPDGPGYDVRHEIEGDILFYEGVTL